MRLARNLALCVVPIFLAACSGGDHANDGPRARATPQPAQFAIRPNIADPVCNGGRGVRVSARFGANPFIAAGAMKDGSTLIAVSDYESKNTVDLYAVTRSCAPLHEFGRAGKATITPSSRPPASSDLETLPDFFYVNAIAPSRRGVLVAGAYKGHWVVGAVTRHGHVDRTFGTGGWAVLPFRGAVTEVVEAPSGRIVVGGDSRGQWAAALSPAGRLERGFGKNGRTELALLGPDSGLRALTVDPNGNVLAHIVFGNNGCWRNALVMLTPSGRPMPQFRKNLGPFGRFWRRLGFNALVGDISANDDGVTFVGIGQRPCAASPATASAPSATGLIARFGKRGRLASPIVSVPSRMYGTVWALHKRTETLVVKSPYDDATRLTLAALRPDGSIDPRFGSQGRASIRTPWRGRYAALDTTVVIGGAGQRAITLVRTRATLSQLQIVRVLF